MNARLQANVLRGPNYRGLGPIATAILDAAAPRKATISRHPMKCTGRPAWGKRDSVLARMVFRNLVETTPAIVIPANPLADTKLRKELRHFGVAFHHE